MLPGNSTNTKMRAVQEVSACVKGRDKDVCTLMQEEQSLYLLHALSLGSLKLSMVCASSEGLNQGACRLYTSYTHVITQQQPLHAWCRRKLIMCNFLKGRS